MSGDWQHGLCGCCDNCKTLLCVWCCPCIVAGKIAEKVGENCCLCGLSMFVPILNLICRAQVRGKVRDQKGIGGSFLGDLAYSCCCGPCALCQEANEVGAVDDMAQSMGRE